jgi:NAD(P)-dependent dehydrogenase (short-subunit alcohol dehydrogenase family)
VAIVTGGSRGIGAATALQLAQHGSGVCVNYRTNEAAAMNVVSAIRENDGTAIAVQADVSAESEVVRLFEMAVDELGPVTALVNNAGIVMPQTRVEDIDAARNGGLIVNVSSAAARLGSPGEYVDYAASKGAIDTLTRGLSLEVADEGIRVNCVRPGFIYTDMHTDSGEPDRVDRLARSIPLQRGGTPEEVANTICWLLSDAASYVTGTFIDVAGGR